MILKLGLDTCSRRYSLNMLSNESLVVQGSLYFKLLRFHHTFVTRNKFLKKIMLQKRMQVETLNHNNKKKNNLVLLHVNA